MWPRSKKAKRSLQDLDPQHIFAGLVLGDDWVQALLVHADPCGLNYLIGSSMVSLDLPPGLRPSLPQLKAAVTRCWGRMDGAGEIEYEKCFLCLPAWATKSRPVSARIPVDCDLRIPGFRTPTIRDRHIRKLEESASLKDAPDYHVAVDLIPHAFVLDDGRRVSDPREEISANLELGGYAVFADLGLVRGVLGCLRKIGVTIDVMTSAHAATEGLLTDDEKRAGTAVVDIDRQAAHFSFYRNGAMCYACCQEGGSDQLLSHAAGALHASTDTVSLRMEQAGRLVVPDAPYDRILSLPLFRWTLSHPSFRRLEDAVTESVAGTMEKVSHCLNATTREMMIPVGGIVLTGDNHLMLRILQEMAQETGIPARVEMQRNLLMRPGTQLTNAARTVAFIRHCAFSPPRRQLYLERFNENALDRVARHARTKAAKTAWRTAVRLADSASRLKTRTAGKAVESERVPAVSACSPVEPRSIPLSVELRRSRARPVLRSWSHRTQHAMRSVLQ